jgi:hypothetical protein
MGVSIPSQLVYACFCCKTQLNGPCREKAPDNTAS